MRDTIGGRRRLRSRRRANRWERPFGVILVMFSAPLSLLFVVAFLWFC